MRHQDSLTNCYCNPGTPERCYRYVKPPTHICTDKQGQMLIMLHIKNLQSVFTTVHIVQRRIGTYVQFRQPLPEHISISNASLYCKSSSSILLFMQISVFNPVQYSIPCKDIIPRSDTLILSRAAIWSDIIRPPVLLTSITLRQYALNALSGITTGTDFCRASCTDISFATLRYQHLTHPKHPPHTLVASGDL